MATSASSSSSPPEDLEWEEWDSTTSPLSFFHHCLAGSFAGVVEHTLLYPLDTVKTCWQSQVLSKASSAGGSGSSGCSMVNNCGVNGGGGGVLSRMMNENGGVVVNEAKPLSSSATSNLKAIHNTMNNPAAPQSHHHGIWSTMKNLMKQGHHLHHHTQHSHGHSLSHQFSHAHVYTLAGNPPNVVDFTSKIMNNNGDMPKGKATTAAAAAATNNNRITKQRPWSKQSRALRNATMNDITAQGMIRSSSSGGGGGMASLGIDTAASSNMNINASSSSSTTAASSNNTGFKRLWRGVQTMFVGCIPAHALYFSSYEIIKSICTDGGHAHHSDNHSSEQQHQHQHQHQQHEGHVGHDTLSISQAMLAGGVATLLHDIVMTPMDTMKQRMQLGHYDNLRHAFVSIVHGDHHPSTTTSTTSSTSSRSAAVAAATGEGWRALYRSLPITVMTNVPYGMIMMTTNEWLRGVLEDGLYGKHHDYNEHEENPFHFATILLSGMGAGTIASAVTAPLDRVKTRLQTQRMGMMLPHHISTTSNITTASSSSGGTAASAIMEERALAAAQGQPKICPKMAVQDVKRTLFPSSTAAAGASSTILPTAAQASSIPKPNTPFQNIFYSTPLEAFQSILQEEGPRGLFRGTLPRIALHAPSVAISWTAYEMAKDWLVWSQQH